MKSLWKSNLIRGWWFHLFETILPTSIYRSSTSIEEGFVL